MGRTAFINHKFTRAMKIIVCLGAAYAFSVSSGYAVEIFSGGEKYNSFEEYKSRAVVLEGQNAVLNQEKSPSEGIPTPEEIARELSEASTLVPVPELSEDDLKATLENTNEKLSEQSEQATESAESLTDATGEASLDGADDALDATDGSSTESDLVEPNVASGAVLPQSGKTAEDQEKINALLKALMMGSNPVQSASPSSP